MPATLPSAARELIDAIKNDQLHGASQLARDALAGLAGLARSLPQDAQLRATLDATAAELVRARPTMAPIENLVGEWRAQLAQLTDQQLVTSAANAAISLLNRSRAAVGQIAQRVAERVPAGSTIITLSASSTLDTCFAALAQKDIRVICAESRPGFEGRNTVRQLATLGIPSTLIADAALGHYCAQADVALIGADNWLADGGVVNKIGSYPLALAAREAGIPFLVACESFKRSREISESVQLEIQNSTELMPQVKPSIYAENLYFEIVPANLLSAVISESGEENEQHQ